MNLTLHRQLTASLALDGSPSRSGSARQQYAYWTLKAHEALNDYRSYRGVSVYSVRKREAEEAAVESRQDFIAAVWHRRSRNLRKRSGAGKW